MGNATSSTSYWANKHHRMTDFYALNALLITPVLLGSQGFVWASMLIWLAILFVYFAVKIPLINRFRAAFENFDAKFWLLSAAGFIAVWVVYYMPDSRVIVGTTWGLIGFLIVYPMARTMDKK